VTTRISRPIGNSNPPTVSVRCPDCRQGVTTESVGQDSHASHADGGELYWGARKCPTPHCGALLLISYKGGQQLTNLVFYPAETLDFDAAKLPDRVRETLEEAVKCHAQQCYTAAAIMVRKTLEELCADREAEGKTLYDRIEALGKKIILPGAMLIALHDLRLLGNDAAHLEARIYDEIGRDEVEAAVEVTKEILKATYQYEDILGRLAALKRPDGATSSAEPS
jgi:hypothetical protein